MGRTARLAQDFENRARHASAVPAKAGTACELLRVGGEWARVRLGPCGTVGMVPLSHLEVDGRAGQGRRCLGCALLRAVCGLAGAAAALACGSALLARRAQTVQLDLSAVRMHDLASRSAEAELRCTTPHYMAGYAVDAAHSLATSDFRVEVRCDGGFVGEPRAVVCTSPGLSYSLRGCHPLGVSCATPTGRLGEEPVDCAASGLEPLPGPAFHALRDDPAGRPGLADCCIPESRHRAVSGAVPSGPDWTSPSGRGRSTQCTFLAPHRSCQRPTGESWDESSVDCEAAGLARIAGDWSAPRDCASGGCGVEECCER